MSQDHPLHRACLDGHLSRVQELLHTDDGRSSLTLADADGRQPLHWAVTSDEKREIVDALLGAGDVGVNAPDGSGWTPLMIASSAGARRLVQTLLQRGADVHASNGKHITALHYASSKNHADIVRELLEYGADVNALDGAKQRPIHRAASAGHDAIVRLLLRPPPRLDGQAHPKTRVNPADRLGNTPLHLAIDSAHAQTAAVLIDVGGADRRRPNADGVMPEEMEGVGGLEQKRVREFLVQSFGPL
ncbi:putative ankyrin-repeat protein [Malassezia caprae]|uniref:Ankyrin-repeat protein n=1 Tax=Malassezia caprae TaxID=1381934 RepID=A0AAF0E9Q4_9BASI|nr:putative ankyrin-repeat protein [Malassezia caprae]